MKMHVLAFAAALCAGAAQAAPIDWNTWSSTSAGTITTTGGPIGVTYSGPALNVYNPYPSYTPTPTFADGVVVNNAPTASNGILQITGGDSSVQTLTFSQAVVDPVMAIWSLGQGGINASFHFLGSAVPTFVSGGPSAEYGGTPIIVSGQDVFGREGNGTVQFKGTFTSISWTNPVYEYWYGFDVGVAGVATTVPEPETYALMLAGLAAVGFVARRRRS
ncbi:PEP-CTERM sorting domain-containing protein [Piscinibacter terrae]|uniref:PEP-CTERM sorting domain-containing protein n=1 Tax=Piscinibacter terrae TaxID=2496871 RepID=A0A3N7JWY5_9BURK|nr:PEP-CTERM sorting domain-containing protein [Albitalea terrae]RQP25339.1 PEP-CTERM sorting domain-containing protein [Albitalea terrae]